MPKKALKTATPTKPKKEKARDRLSADQFPKNTLEEAIKIPKLLHDEMRGGPASWSQVASALKISPTNNRNKYPVWSAKAYGLLIEDKDGNYSLSEVARKMLAPTREGEDREAKIKAVLTPVGLSRFYTDYNGNFIPSDEFFRNILVQNYQIPADRVDEIKALIIGNAVFCSIIEEKQGRQIIRIDGIAAADQRSTSAEPKDLVAPAVIDKSDFKKSCFIITPLGEDGSEFRKHADLIFNQVIAPVCAEAGIDLKPIRADQIEKSGLITKQIFEYIAHSALCIADLSYNNPNVFYEVGIRHAFQLPMVQIIRKGDKIPFDVSQGRTIKIDLTDLYKVVDAINGAKNELREYIKDSLAPAHTGDDNPIKIYLPGVSVTIK